MKNNIFIIILLLIMLFPAIKTSAQTPFDVFSPETSRIILDGDSIAAASLPPIRALSHSSVSGGR